MNDVIAHMRTLAPAATVEITNLRSDCRMLVTLGIWRISNWDDLGIPDVVSFRTMVENGQGAQALAIINILVTEAHQELTGFAPFALVVGH